MIQLELMQNIAKYFARFSEQIKVANSNNEFSINIHAENLLVHVLNLVYEVKLKNLNTSESRNYSAIDLLGRNGINTVSFQITSTNSIDKIKDCIQKYFRNGVYEKANKLYVFILTSKQKKYSKESLLKLIDDEFELLIKEGRIANRTDIPFTFDPDVNILDKTDLYRKLNHDNNLNKIIEVERYLKKQFDVIEEKNNLSQYYNKLKNYFYETVMDDEKGMTLNDVYIEPSFSVLHSAFKKGDTRFTNKRTEKFYATDERYKIQEFIDDILKGDNPLDFSHCNYRVILILGYPGQGKSSFCKKLLNDYIRKERFLNKPIYYYQLRNIRQVRDFIYSPLTALYEEACNLTELNLDKFEFNKSLLILDGLDELYMRENLKLEEIDKLCIEVIRLAEKHTELQIILTSRYGYVEDEKLNKENILIAQLSTFSCNLQNEWLSKYQLFHPETWITEEKIRLFNSETKYRHIKELIEQPLLLHMVASIKNEIDENTNRAKIYQQLFNELIDRKYAREGQLEIFQNIEKNDLRELVREIAFAIYQNGNEYITKLDLIKLKATQSFLKLLPEKNFRDSIKGIMISFYFKEIEKRQQDELHEDKSNYAIEFLHKSLREYMTAEKIFHSISDQFLDRRNNGKYVIDDARRALEIINEILGNQSLTDELKYHLRGIVKNESKLNKEELTDRLFSFLPEFVSTDFIKEYRMDHERSAINIALRSFNGFWFFVSCLGLNKNYITESIIKQRLADYFMLISNSYGTNVTGFDLSNQDFSDIFFSNVVFIGCLFENTNFSECDIERVYFTYCKFKNTNFEAGYLEDIHFTDCIIENSNFQDTYFGEISISNTKIMHSDFSLSSINDISIDQYEFDEDSQKTAISDCIFTDARIDNESLEKLNDWYPNIKEQQLDISGETDTDDAEEENYVTNNEESIPEDYKRIIFPE